MPRKPRWKRIAHRGFCCLRLVLHSSHFDKEGGELPLLSNYGQESLLKVS